MVSNATHEKIKALREVPWSAENRREFWSEKDEKKIIKLYKQGYGISEMAVGLKRTENAIFLMIKKLGLEPAMNNKHPKECKVPECIDVANCLCSDCQNYENCTIKLDTKS